MPQLQINQGPQDALLYDNTRSYFTNVGYVRTSNFQQELRDVDPQNSATLGSTVQFVIPKAADLLGPVDLMLEFTKNTNDLNSALAASDSLFAAWVECLGFAIIDKIVFSVGSHDIETITGDQLYITNELMRGDEHRFAQHQVLKTGRPAVGVTAGTGAVYSPIFDADESTKTTGRLIAAKVRGASGTATSYNYDGKKLIIPLGLFFTKHPSQYFPLAAIAGCNDVRISVKLRTLNELLLLKSNADVTGGIVGTTNVTAFDKYPVVNLATGATKLRCHYVHVTGPEASLLMNKEHVRLLKLWQNHNVTKTLTGTAIGSSATKQKLFDFELPFLHPVQELIIVIRKASEMSNSTDATATVAAYDQGARAKNYFAFHGAGKDPNIDSDVNSIHENNGASNITQAYLTVDNFKLTLNGQERHPSLSSVGLDRDYLMNRLMPMLHSNTSSAFSHVADSHYYNTSSTNIASVPFAVDDFKALSELLDRKEIYVYPFALNPEGANPSGAVNFSKVSHAKLTIEGYAHSTAAQDVEYRCDVWGVHYNWLQIKDGRALTSFA